MKRFVNAFVAAAFCLVSTIASAAGNLPNATFWVGYNEPWIKDDYGNWLASNPSFGIPSNFSTDRVLLNSYMSGMAAGKAKVVRIWLFPALQGIVRSGNGLLTNGLTPEFLTNLRYVLALARVRGLKVYVTAMNGNDMKVFKGTAFEPYVANLLLDANARKFFRLKALLPVLGVLNANQDVVYAFDVVNEMEAAVSVSLVDTAGGRSWIREMATYVGTTSPWIAVTASSGFAPVTAIVGGLYTGLNLSFYDAHIYSDAYTTYDFGQLALCNKASIDKVQMILGEFGQKSTAVSDFLQYNVTKFFLARSKASCIRAAFPWKYETTSTSLGQPWFTYYRPNGTFRPAYTYIQNNF